MTDLGWRAQSANLSKKSRRIEGLGEDFGFRVCSAVEELEFSGDKKRSKLGPSNKRLNLFDKQNKNVSDRASKDADAIQSEDEKEKIRLYKLGLKSKIYEELKSRANLDDEASNDLYEVDFIAKSLEDDSKYGNHLPNEVGDVEFLNFSDSERAKTVPMHPEDILAHQLRIKNEMQGTRGGFGGNNSKEYSTYDKDQAELDERNERVDELNRLNAERNAEFEKINQHKKARNTARNAANQRLKAELVKKLLAKKLSKV